MKRIEQSSVFETYTIEKDDDIVWSEFLSRVRKMVEASKIKVVDIRRQGDKLTITYRRL